MSTEMPALLHSRISLGKRGGINEESEQVTIDQHPISMSESSINRGQWDPCNGYTLHVAPDNGYNLHSASDNSYNLRSCPDSVYNLHSITGDCVTSVPRNSENYRRKYETPDAKNLSDSPVCDLEESTLNVETCSVDQSSSASASGRQNSSKMEGPRSSSLLERVQQQLEIYKKLKTDGNYDEGKTYSNEWFVVRRIDNSGGVLQLRGGSEDCVVILRIPEGALSEPRDIYMAVNWHGSGFGPTVKCGPSGTRFDTGVYIFLPIYGTSEELILQKREHEGATEASAWIDNPESCAGLTTDNHCVIETMSFSDYRIVPRRGFKEFNLLVYVQGGPAVGGYLCIRLHLVRVDDDEARNRVKVGESCFGGYCVEDTTLMVKKGKEEIKITVELQGLQPLEQNLSRTTTEEWISNAKEMATCFIVVQMENADNAEARIKFDLPGIPHEGCVQIKPLSIEQGATMLQDDIQPHDSTSSVLCVQMVERLADLMDIREDAPLKLINLIQPEKPTVKLNQDKVRMYGGSRTRYVLRYYECLCIVRGTGRDQALINLHGYLNGMREEIAAEIVQKYFPSPSTVTMVSNGSLSVSQDDPLEMHDVSDAAQRDSGEPNMNKPQDSLCVVEGQEQHDVPITKRDNNPRLLYSKKNDSGCYSDSRLSQKIPPDKPGVDESKRPAKSDTPARASQEYVEAEEETLKGSKQSESPRLNDVISESSITEYLEDKTNEVDGGPGLGISDGIEFPDVTSDPVQGTGDQDAEVETDIIQEDRKVRRLQEFVPSTCNVHGGKGMESEHITKRDNNPRMQDRKGDSGCFSDARLSQQIPAEIPAQNPGAEANNPEKSDTQGYTFQEEVKAEGRTFTEQSQFESPRKRDLMAESSGTESIEDETKEVGGRPGLGNSGEIENPDATNDKFRGQVTSDEAAEVTKF